MNEFDKILIIALASLILFFVSKFISTWYFDINDIIKNQKEQIELLKIIANIESGTGSDIESGTGSDIESDIESGTESDTESDTEIGTGKQSMDSVKLRYENGVFWYGIHKWSNIHNLKKDSETAKNYINLIIGEKKLPLLLVDFKLFEGNVVEISLYKKTANISGIQVNDAVVEFDKIFS